MKEFIINLGLGDETLDQCFVANLIREALAPYNVEHYTLSVQTKDAFYNELQAGAFRAVLDGADGGETTESVKEFVEKLTLGRSLFTLADQPTSSKDNTIRALIQSYFSTMEAHQYLKFSTFEEMLKTYMPDSVDRRHFRDNLQMGSFATAPSEVLRIELSLLGHTPTNSKYTAIFRIVSIDPKKAAEFDAKESWKPDELEKMRKNDGPIGEVVAEHYIDIFVKNDQVVNMAVCPAEGVVRARLPQ